MTDRHFETLDIPLSPSWQNLKRFIKILLWDVGAFLLNTCQFVYCWYHLLCRWSLEVNSVLSMCDSWYLSLQQQQHLHHLGLRLLNSHHTTFSSSPTCHKKPATSCCQCCLTS